MIRQIADIPYLEACSAFGETPDEALIEVQKAKELWLEAARAERKPIPQPKHRPVIYQAFYPPTQKTRLKRY
jgi:predicted RNase H-like HicB family nuclease